MLVVGMLAVRAFLSDIFLAIFDFLLVRIVKQEQQL